MAAIHGFYKWGLIRSPLDRYLGAKLLQVEAPLGYDDVIYHDFCSQNVISIQCIMNLKQYSHSIWIYPRTPGCHRHHQGYYIVRIGNPYIKTLFDADILDGFIDPRYSVPSTIFVSIWPSYDIPEPWISWNSRRFPLLFVTFFHWVYHWVHQEKTHNSTNSGQMGYLKV